MLCKSISIRSTSCFLYLLFTGHHHYDFHVSPSSSLYQQKNLLYSPSKRGGIFSPLELIMTGFSLLSLYPLTYVLYPIPSRETGDRDNTQVHLTVNYGTRGPLSLHPLRSYTASLHIAVTIFLNFGFHCRMYMTRTSESSAPA